MRVEKLIFASWAVYFRRVLLDVERLVLDLEELRLVREGELLDEDTFPRE